MRLMFCFDCFLGITCPIRCISTCFSKKCSRFQKRVIHVLEFGAGSRATSDPRLARRRRTPPLTRVRAARRAARHTESIEDDTPDGGPRRREVPSRWDARGDRRRPGAAADWTERRREALPARRLGRATAAPGRRSRASPEQAFPRCSRRPTRTVGSPLARGRSWGSWTLASRRGELSRRPTSSARRRPQPLVRELIQATEDRDEGGAPDPRSSNGSDDDRPRVLPSARRVVDRAQWRPDDGWLARRRVSTRSSTASPARPRRPVLLVGEHGVGKSTLILEAVALLGRRGGPRSRPGPPT